MSASCMEQAARWRAWNSSVVPSILCWWILRSLPQDASCRCCYQADWRMTLANRSRQFVERWIWILNAISGILECMILAGNVAFIHGHPWAARLRLAGGKSLLQRCTARKGRFCICGDVTTSPPRGERCSGVESCWKADTVITACSPRRPRWRCVFSC
jgi:hypothetical protein